jgi:hypothetical protein
MKKRAADCGGYRKVAGAIEATKTLMRDYMRVVGEHCSGGCDSDSNGQK